MNIKNYEKEKNKNMERNKKFIEEFKKYLTEQGLVLKTINKHISNIDLYLNEYLNYYETTKMEDGIYEVDTFFSDWFIRKCMWATKNSIKETASSIKKFYNCMQKLEYIKKEDYKQLCEEIKENMEYWLESLKEYDDGTYFDFF